MSQYNPFWCFWNRVLCSSVCSGIHCVVCSPGWSRTQQSCLHLECWDFRCALPHNSSGVALWLPAYFFTVVWIELRALHMLGKYSTTELPQPSHFWKTFFWDVIPCLATSALSDQFPGIHCPRCCQLLRHRTVTPLLTGLVMPQSSDMSGGWGG